ncbi:hypothetical protein H4R18_000078 [Coemansia javaensis]|uniref:Uncharacterized protein n=1 Tax=Coemansia javaensis TaxID=2761396 RepID=A0A9W8HHY9_9FUNG|nr:hypothetical protein H4R18_000078 [Coemansia javaensis]
MRVLAAVFAAALGAASAGRLAASPDSPAPGLAAADAVGRSDAADLYAKALSSVHADQQSVSQGRGTGTQAAEGTLDMAFGDVFALRPESIRYIAGLLETLSRTGPQKSAEFAPLFGVQDAERVTPEAMASTAGLIASVGAMDAGALELVAKATGAAAATAAPDDPLVRHGSLFALSDILAMHPKRVRQVAHFFGSVAHMDAPELQSFLRDIGWVRLGAGKRAERSSAPWVIPDFGYMFPVDDAVLQGMADAAWSYTPRSAARTIAVRPKVERYLTEARAFIDVLPTIVSTLGLGNDPLVAALTQIIALSYKYPNESYWSLALRYYQEIGMPGIAWITSYPGQQLGNLASSFVSDAVTSALSGVIAGLFGTGAPAPTPTPTHASPSLLSPSSLSHSSSPSPTMPSSSLSSSSPSSSSSHLSSPSPSSSPSSSLTSTSPAGGPVSGKQTPAVVTMTVTALRGTVVIGIVAIAGSASVALASITIPGILSLDLSSGGGLKLNVLSGFIQANIGGHSQDKTRGSHPARPSSPPSAF